MKLAFVNLPILHTWNTVPINFVLLIPVLIFLKINKVIFE